MSMSLRIETTFMSLKDTVFCYSIILRIHYDILAYSSGGRLLTPLSQLPRQAEGLGRQSPSGNFLVRPIRYYLLRGSIISEIPFRWIMSVCVEFNLIFDVKGVGVHEELTWGSALRRATEAFSALTGATAVATAMTTKTFNHVFGLHLVIGWQITSHKLSTY